MNILDTYLQTLKTKYGDDNFEKYLNYTYFDVKNDRGEEDNPLIEDIRNNIDRCVQEKINELTRYRPVSCEKILMTTFANACWFDSSLYVLFNINQFINIFLDPSVIDCGPLCKNTHLIIASLTYSNDDNVSTARLYKVLEKMGCPLCTRNQEAADEFISYYLSHLYDELRHGKNYLSEYLVEQFYYSLEDNDYCRKCLNNRSCTKFQPQPIINLYVPKKAKNNEIDFYDLCKYYFIPNSALKYSEECSYCHKTSDTFQITSINGFNVPSIFIFKLSRSFLNDKSVKVNYPYVFPVCRLIHGIESISILKAVIIHEDWSKNVAHYYSYVRADQDNQWYKMDRKVIQKLDQKDLDTQLLNNRNASILVYENISKDYITFPDHTFDFIYYPELFVEDHLLYKYLSNLNWNNNNDRIEVDEDSDE